MMSCAASGTTTPVSASTCPRRMLSGYTLSKLAKEGTDLLGQQLGFFQGGEMTASGHLFPSQNVVRSLAPLSGRTGDFLGKHGHASWGRDLVVFVHHP